MSTKTLRNANIEWLRLFSIFLITLNHVSSLGINLNEASNVFNTVSALFFVQGGKFGSQLFLIISAWYLTEGKFRWQRIFSIWFQTFFYGIVLSLADQLFFGIDLSPLEILKNALPITGSTYWYARSYILLLCLMPFLQKLQDLIHHQKIFLIICTVLFSLIPTLTFNGLFLQNIPGGIYLMTLLRNETLWFSFVYILIRYLKQSGTIDKIKHPLSKGCLLYFIMFILTVIIYYYGRSGAVYADLFTKRYTVFRDLNSPLCLAGGLCLFLYVYRKQTCTIPFINRLSTHAFGVYLFQCNSAIKPFIWKTIFPFSSWYSSTSAAFPFFALCAVIVIMLMGIIFDCLYQFYAKPVNQLIASIKAS